MAYKTVGTVDKETFAVVAPVKRLRRLPIILKVVGIHTRTAQHTHTIYIYTYIYMCVCVVCVCVCVCVCSLSEPRYGTRAEKEI